MKTLTLLALFFALPLTAQNVRFDYAAQTVPTAGNPVQSIPGAAVSFYTGCTALPCSTYANVFTSVAGTTACGTSAQVVLPLSNACTSVADPQGNFGGWLVPGTYQYTLTASSHTYGPYSFTVAQNGNGNGLINGQLIATNYPGTDIFAQANSAFTSCSGSCTVYIPAGVYNNVTTTLMYPATSNGHNALYCDHAALINYTGTGKAIQVGTTTGGFPEAGVMIDGCQINGTSSGTDGIWIGFLNGATVQNTRISGFTTGSDYTCYGGNTINFINDFASGGYINFNLAYNTAINFGCNAVHIIGSHADGTPGVTVYPVFIDRGGNNTVENTTFDGASTTELAGCVYLNSTVHTVIHGTYCEPGADTNPEIYVGLGSLGTVIDSNILASNYASESIYDNGGGTNIVNNTEGGSPPYFIVQGSSMVSELLQGNTGYFTTLVSRGGNPFLEIGNATSGQGGGSYYGSITANPQSVGLNGLKIVPLASTSGRWFVCVDNSGNFISTASQCTGVLSGTTASIGGSSISAGACTSGNVTVTGAVVGHTVSVSASNGSLPNGKIVLSAAVTATNTVAVQLCAITTNTPTALTYNVTTY